MKKILYISFICTLIGLFSSCNSSNAPTIEKCNPPEPAVEPQLALIKMSPQLQEQVFVSPVVDSCVIDHSLSNLITLYHGDKLCLCNPTKLDTLLAEFAKTQLGIVGTNPYRLLENGYAIIDWRWTNFQPLSGGFRSCALGGAYSTNDYYQNATLANEEYYLLPIHWQELTDLMAVWNLEEGQQIEKPEVKYINLEDIEQYGEYPVSYKSFFYDTNFYYIYAGLYSRDPENFPARIEDLDRYQAAYVETLNQMIRNNDLDKWTKTY